MKIIFVYREKEKGKKSTVQNAQAESLIKSGMNVIKYLVLNGGAIGYISNLLKLFIFLRKNNYDIVHSHYSVTSYIASLAFPKKQVVSLMGSDVNEAGKIKLFFLRFFSRYIWNFTIVKSKKMQNKIPFANIIPNGVNFDVFKPVSKNLAIQKVNFDNEKKHIIFITLKPECKNKNFELAEKAVKTLNHRDVKLVVLSNISHKDLCYYYNAADVMLLTSLKEGSPNVIKEAMACCCPIVTTDVGDVREVLGNTEGTFIVSNEPADVANKLALALAFNKRTKGRERIMELGLDSDTIARKIVNIYEKVLTD